MSKPQIDENEYIELVNSKMKEHEIYKDGMKIELAPAHSNKPSGFDVVGGMDAKTIAVWAQAYIESKYERQVQS